MLLSAFADDLHGHLRQGFHHLAHGGGFFAGGVAVLGALGDTLGDGRQAEKTERQLEFPVVDMIDATALAIGLDVFLLGGNAQ